MSDYGYEENALGVGEEFAPGTMGEGLSLMEYEQKKGYYARIAKWSKVIGIFIIVFAALLALIVPLSAYSMSEVQKLSASLPASSTMSGGYDASGLMKFVTSGSYLPLVIVSSLIILGLAMFLVILLFKASTAHRAALASPADPRFNAEAVSSLHRLFILILVSIGVGLVLSIVSVFVTISVL
jgi:hypothetical protein